MKGELLFQELREFISQCDICVLYEPIQGEIDYNDPGFPLVLSGKRILLPQSDETDPFFWADKIFKEHRGCKVCVLVPGKTFDTSGTRHGRGGGWYDRFLSKIPVEWVRVGVAYASQISDTPLLKNSWDEPVDWIITKDEDSLEFNCLKTLRARI